MPRILYLPSISRSRCQAEGTARAMSFLAFNLLRTAFTLIDDFSPVPCTRQRFRIRRIRVRGPESEHTFARVVSVVVLGAGIRLLVFCQESSYSEQERQERIAHGRPFPELVIALTTLNSDFTFD